MVAWHYIEAIHVQQQLLQHHCIDRVLQSHIWGWLDPAADTALMPITYLKGAGAAVGRTREAVDAQHDKALYAAISAGRQVHNFIVRLGYLRTCLQSLCVRTRQQRVKGHLV